MWESYHIYEMDGTVKKVTKEESEAYGKALPKYVEVQTEEAEQQHIPFEDEQEVNGKKYPLIMMPSGLYKYTSYVAPEYKKPEPKIIKLNPLWATRIRAKDAK
jgi:hypothetical protein